METLVRRMNGSGGAIMATFMVGHTEIAIRKTTRCVFFCICAMFVSCFEQKYSTYNGKGREVSHCVLGTIVMAPWRKNPQKMLKAKKKGKVMKVRRQ